MLLQRFSNKSISCFLQPFDLSKKKRIILEKIEKKENNLFMLTIS